MATPWWGAFQRHGPELTGALREVWSTGKGQTEQNHPGYQGNRGNQIPLPVLLPSTSRHWTLCLVPVCLLPQIWAAQGRDGTQPATGHPSNPLLPDSANQADVGQSGLVKDQIQMVPMPQGDMNPGFPPSWWGEPCPSWVPIMLTLLNAAGPRAVHSPRTANSPETRCQTWSYSRSHGSSLVTCSTASPLKHSKGTGRCSCSEQRGGGGRGGEGPDLSLTGILGSPLALSSWPLLWQVRGLGQTAGLHARGALKVPGNRDPPRPENPSWGWVAEDCCSF